MIEDYKTDPTDAEEQLLEVPKIDVLPEAGFEKIVGQDLEDATVENLLADWLEAQLLPKNIARGVQIDENSLSEPEKGLKIS